MALWARDSATEKGKCDLQYFCKGLSVNYCMKSHLVEDSIEEGGTRRGKKREYLNAIIKAAYRLKYWLKNIPTCV